MRVSIGNLWSIIEWLSEKNIEKNPDSYWNKPGLVWSQD